MIIEIARLDELDIWMLRGDRIGLGIDPFDEHACKQKIREHNDTAIAKPRHMLKRGFDKREGHT